MNIELNKCYRTRDGRKARVICVDRRSDFQIVALVSYNIPNDVEDCIQYLPDGRKRVTDDSMLDLISEWSDKPEMDRSVLPAWANKAVAMDSDGEWFCFSGLPYMDDHYWADDGTCVKIPDSHAPKWSGDWRDSLRVFED